MQNENNIPEKILDFLRRHDWAELNNIDKEEVRRVLSPKEYDRLRNAYRGLQAAHDRTTPIPRPETKAALMARFSEKHKAPLIVRLREARIPAWQAAAAAVVLFALGLALRPDAEALPVKDLAARVVDTVYVQVASTAKAHTTDDTIALVALPKKAGKPKEAVTFPERRKATSMPSVPVFDDPGAPHVLRLDEGRSLSPAGRNWEEDSLAEKFVFSRS